MLAGVVAVVVLVASAVFAADDRVILRQAEGDKARAARFFRPTKNGRPRPIAHFPTEEDFFDLLAVAARVEAEETSNPSALAPVVLRDAFGWPFVPEEPTVVYDYAEVPSGIRETLCLAVRTVVVAEIRDKPHDKTRVKKKKEYVSLPAPTARDLKRKKKHLVLSTQEEYRIRAELDGTPVIRVTNMPYLKTRGELIPPGPGEPAAARLETASDNAGHASLLMVFEAEMPVRGLVSYKVPKALSATTKYRATVALRVVVEIRATREGSKIKLATPEVLDIDVRLARLEMSNDLLNAARRPIRDFINDELRRNDKKIRDKSNKAVSKAVDDQTFRLPLLEYLLRL
ncbi:MAG TPA: hypothetical protein DD670_16935 [Planctomycetaceae bacterium]|nr:hypothetical protein [Planctomycetaceae bacterium]